MQSNDKNLFWGNLIHYRCTLELSSHQYRQMESNGWGILILIIHYEILHFKVVPPVFQKWSKMRSFFNKCEMLLDKWEVVKCTILHLWAGKKDCVFIFSSKILRLFKYYIWAAGIIRGSSLITSDPENDKLKTWGNNN